MDKKWVESRKCKYAEEAKAKRAKIVAKIVSSKLLRKECKKALIDALDKSGDGFYNITETSMMLALFDVMGPHDEEYKRFDDVRDFIHSLNTNEYGNLLCNATSERIDRYLDSEPMEFDGDIIITDPCYIIRAEHHGTTPITKDDWDSCGYGVNMEVLGINHYMTRDTIYGDWGCTVYNTDTDQPMGAFCADAGLVSVFLLDEVLKYNPDFDYHKERTWTTTLIQDFSGTVQFVVERIEGVYEEDSEYHNAGDKWEDFSLHVVGHGINKKTGEPINFRSVQSSM